MAQNSKAVHPKGDFFEYIVKFLCHKINYICEILPNSAKCTDF